jgi:hypothetical protein
MVESFAEGAGEALEVAALPLALVHLVSMAWVRETQGAWRMLARVGASVVTMAVVFLALDHTHSLDWVWP